MTSCEVAIFWRKTLLRRVYMYFQQIFLISILWSPHIISILWSPHITIRFPNILCPSYFTTQTLYPTSPLTQNYHLSVQHNLLDLMTQTACIVEECRSWGFSLLNLLKSHVSSSSSATNISLRTVNYNTVNLHSSLMWKNEYRSVYFKFIIKKVKGKTKVSWYKSQVWQNFSLLLISSWIYFLIFLLLPDILTRSVGLCQ